MTTYPLIVTFSDKISAVTFSLAAFFPIIQFLRSFSLSKNTGTFLFLDGMRQGWPWLLMAVGTFITDLITFIIKRIVEKTLPKLTFWRRPKGAFACDALSMYKNIDSTGKSGFPSGHSATIAFFAFSVFLTEPISQYFRMQQNNEINNENKSVVVKGLITPLFFACLFTLLIMISRVKKSCHTILQTIVGALIGISMAVLYIWLIIKYKASL